ncbi:MAG: hypothetical protein C0617_03360 [Desulfuromonas sp.]|nr:MAG: hypothetical protein C0617_03360 [Desulfuromonas sp.]
MTLNSISGYTKKPTFIFTLLYVFGKEFLLFFDKLNLGSFLIDLFRFKRLLRNYEDRFIFNWRDLYPCFKDKSEETPFDRHYVYHPAWAARVLARTKPQFHIDISSSLHFSTLVSSFIPVRFFDYRPVDLNLTNFCSKSADLLSLPFETSSIQSLSCMHVVEHVGLGRYGDPLDPEGDLKAVAELKRVVAADGDLLFVVPVGVPRIMFNAHRIYSPEQIESLFSGFDLLEFALIPENPSDGGLVIQPSQKLVASQKYGCGCFWFRKKHDT